MINEYLELLNEDSKKQFLKIFNELLTKSLLYGSKQKNIKNKLIDVSYVRGVGKTYALINFAKKYNYYVITSTNNQANILKKEYSYLKIYSVGEALLKKDNKYVVDEDVAGLHLYNTGLNIITGYVCNNLNKFNNYSTKVLSMLKEDLDLLLEKRQKALEEGNLRLSIDYTRLIKDTLMLIHDEEKTKNIS